MILVPFLGRDPLGLLASFRVVAGLSFFLLVVPSCPFVDWGRFLENPLVHSSSCPLSCSGHLTSARQVPWDRLLAFHLDPRLPCPDWRTCAGSLTMVGLSVVYRCTEVSTEGIESCLARSLSL